MDSSYNSADCLYLSRHSRWTTKEESLCMVVQRSAVFLSFLGWSETESTWYVGHYLAYSTRPRRWMIMSVEQLVEWLAGEIEVIRENLPQCHFIYHKSHMTWPGLVPGLPRWEPSVVSVEINYGELLLENLALLLPQALSKPETTKGLVSGWH
jgi:hypothetical protein